MKNLNEHINDHLSIRNVAPHILEKTNTLIESAIWELKRKEVIPPKVLEFKSLDKKEEKVIDGEVKYNFYFLPKDFYTLDEFYVEDGSERSVPYQHTSYDNYIDSRRTNDRRKFFSITDLTVEDENRKVLIANPFPKDGDTIIVKYFEDGTEDLVNRLGKRYWSAILNEIEGALNLKPAHVVDDKRNEEISSSKNQKGKNKANNTLRKVRGTFFKGTRYRGNY